MIDGDLLLHICKTTGLPPSQAARVIGDVLAFHQESVEDFVKRRHAQLRTHGTKNEEAYQIIADELTTRVVAAPQLTVRQIRRIIYT